MRRRTGHGKSEELVSECCRVVDVIPGEGLEGPAGRSTTLAWT